MQRGIEGAILDEHFVAGDLLNPARDPVAVERRAVDRLQDEDPEGALQQIDSGSVHKVPAPNYRVEYAGLMRL